MLHATLFLLQPAPMGGTYSFYNHLYSLYNITNRNFSIRQAQNLLKQQVG